MLYNMIDQGKVLEAGFQEDALFVQRAIEKAIYGYLIPQAWPKSNLDLHPFILDGQAPCGTNNPASQWVDDKDGEASYVCYNGNTYYLMTFSGLNVDCSGGGDVAVACQNLNFMKLPGVDQLDGKNWGGVTRDDFIAGAVESFKADGNKNGWATIDITNSDAVNSVIENGLRAPGVIQIPVCSGKEGFQNWNDHGRMGHTDGSNYPCS